MDMVLYALLKKQIGNIDPGTVEELQKLIDQLPDNLDDLLNKQDKLTGKAGQILSFDEAGNPIAIDMPAAEGGTLDHSQLINRDHEDSHPISAISGWEEMTNQDINLYWQEE